MRVDEAVGRALVACGVEHVFGVVGSGNFHVTDAIGQRRVVLVRQAKELDAVLA